MFDPKQKKLRTYHARLNRALHYIDQHIDGELSLAEAQKSIPNYGAAPLRVG